jgi:peptidoglycan/xylan/chitin deacetylase (PgdA/CDA1 family)
MNNRDLVILAYHSICDVRDDSINVHPKSFIWQIGYYLKKGYRSIDLDDLIIGDFEKKEKLLLITFDDGYENNYSVAFPILKKFNLKAHIFLTVNLIDTKEILWWDVSKTKYKQKNLFRILNWNQIFEMKNYGIKFGSHTLNHPKLTEISTSEVRFEVNKSREILSDKLGVDIDSFCYPHGDYNKEVLETVKKAGYKNAVVTSGNDNNYEGNYCLERIGIYYSTSKLIFFLKNNKYFRKFNEYLQ